MKKGANEIREAFIEICLEIGAGSQKYSVPRFNRAVDKLGAFIRDELADDGISEPSIIQPLLEHENEYVRQRAAVYCYSKNFERERCMNILDDILNTTKDKWMIGHVLHFKHFTDMYLHT